MDSYPVQEKYGFFLKLNMLLIFHATQCLKGGMWKIYLCSINPLAVHEENSIMPHHDVKVVGSGNYLEGAATVSC